MKKQIKRQRIACIGMWPRVHFLDLQGLYTFWTAGVTTEWAVLIFAHIRTPILIPSRSIIIYKRVWFALDTFLADTDLPRSKSGLPIKLQLCSHYQRMFIHYSISCSVVSIPLHIVSCSDLFITHEKGSGETHIQLWIRAAISGHGQSDCRMVSTSQSRPRLKINEIDCRSFSRQSMNLHVPIV